MDDTFTNNTTAKGTFISIRGIGVQSSTHLVNPETYDFVFFANEPYYIPVINQLNYITAYDIWMILCIQNAIPCPNN